MATNDLTAARLRELFHYEPETGVFTRLVRVTNNIPTSKPVGTLNQEGYIRTKIDRQIHLLHRLAWLYIHGHHPALLIDHINGIKTDNRMANLRQATITENMQNQRKAQKGTKSGLLGAYANSGKWKSAIQVDGITHNIGNFDTAIEAHEAYIAAKRRLHSTCSI